MLLSESLSAEHIYTGSKRLFYLTISLAISGICRAVLLFIYSSHIKYVQDSPSRHRNQRWLTEVVVFAYLTSGRQTNSRGSHCPVGGSEVRGHLRTCSNKLSLWCVCASNMDCVWGQECNEEHWQEWRDGGTKVLGVTALPWRYCGRVWGGDGFSKLGHVLLMAHRVLVMPHSSSSIWIFGCPHSCLYILMFILDAPIVVFI